MKPMTLCLPYRPRCSKCLKVIAEAFAILDDLRPLLTQPAWFRDAAINDILWRLSEGVGPTIPHKFLEVHFRSLAAHASPVARGLQHDHVFQRAVIHEQILYQPDRASLTAAKVVACIVTKEEHKRLSKPSKLDGWDRYKEARVEVIDARFDDCDPAHYKIKL